MTAFRFFPCFALQKQKKKPLVSQLYLHNLQDIVIYG